MVMSLGGGFGGGLQALCTRGFLGTGGFGELS